MKVNKVFPILLFMSLFFYLGIKFSYSKLAPTKTSQVTDLSQTAEVLPDSVNLGISWGDVILKMIKEGAIDKDKFLKRHPEAEQLLQSPNNNSIIVTQENSALILNLLWPLGISNKTQVLSESPMGTKYKGQEGNFASTGGWTLGAQDGGKLFNSKSLVNLTSEQENLVKKIAANIYRPCCGNSTHFPDCNHGMAMLGLLELMASQGVSEQDMWKTALAVNSYWFPNNYLTIATYMKNKGVDWKDVNSQEMLGIDYSSSQGYARIASQVAQPQQQSSGGGNGCGVDSGGATQQQSQRQQAGCGI